MEYIGRCVISERWIISLGSFNEELIEKFNMRPKDELSFFSDDNKNIIIKHKKFSEIKEENEKRYKEGKK